MSGRAASTPTSCGRNSPPWRKGRGSRPNGSGEQEQRMTIDNARLPSRLHHTAYVTKDMEATRKFYEEVIGLPLIATWSESDELFGAMRTYCPCFFGLGDGSALAFFN